jgi:hypothetical protein
MSEELDSIVEFSVDLNKQDQPEPLPSGEYRGVIRGARVRESQRGTRYAEVAFYIDPEQYPADYDDGNPDGMTLMYRRASMEDNPNSRFGLKRFIEAIGAPLSKKINVSEWIGQEAALEIGHEPWEGVNRAVIQRVRAD